MNTRCFALVAFLVSIPQLTAADAPITSSVVKIYALADTPDLTMPWQTLGIMEGGGSGVIIEGQRILTNAHVVEDAVSLEVKRADGSERFVARTVFISHDADLALLEVKDKRFFEGARAVPLGKMPKLEQRVIVYGFPIGGDTLSITSGIVSRVEVGTYSQSNRDLLSVQTDAAINSGNSGGPVMTEGVLVGIAVASIDEAENVGYMIPAPVVRHFLKDVADGRYDGFPRLGIQTQDMESEAQRRGAGLRDGQKGALVLRVDYGGPSYGVLRPRDVLTAVDGHPIANDLTIAWPGVGRLHYSQAYLDKQIGESVTATILRNGKTLKKTIKLKPHTPLVPGRRTTDRPRYLIFGGLVFQPASKDYLRDYEIESTSLYNYAVSRNFVTKDRREIILLQRVQPHPVNRGYQDREDRVVRLVNGTVPRDMNHLASIIDKAKGKWLRIVVDDGSLLTLDLKAARKAQREILETYGIDEDRYLGPKKRK